jgi:hypothetical protein
MNAFEQNGRDKDGRLSLVIFPEVRSQPQRPHTVFAHGTIASRNDPRLTSKFR